MGERSVGDLRKRLAARDTEELQAILAARDRGEWTAEALEAVRELLIERGAALAAAPAAVAAPAETPRRVSYVGRGAFVGGLTGAFIGVFGKSPDPMFAWISVVGPIITGIFVGAVIGGFVTGYKVK